MIIKKVDTVSQQIIDAGGVKGVTKQVLLGAGDGAPNFTMRRFIVAPGGFTFFHSHDFEHEVYILQGKGAVLEGEKQIPVSRDTAVFVPANEVHQFKNTGNDDLIFLCLVTNDNN